MLISFGSTRVGIVVLAAIVPFIVGFFWYGPLFGKSWMKQVGLTNRDISRSSISKIFGISFLSMLLAALFIGGIVTSLRRDFTILEATLTGGLLGLSLAATALAVSYQYAERTIKLMLIDASYIVVSYALMGLIFGWLL